MGNSASALPYSIGKPVAVASSSLDNIPDGWVLHEGSRKSDNSSVSVFVAKKPALLKSILSNSSTNRSSSQQPSLNLLAPALHHFQYSKKLRHPHILQVLATLDTDHPTETTDHHHHPSQAASSGSAATSTNVAVATASKETGDLIIVTEPCVPIETWLKSSPPPTPEQIAWGLESVVRALHFLHSSAQLAHGNVSPSSLFVTRSGDVKLWNFSLVTSITPDVGVSWHFQEYESTVAPISYRSPERIDGRWKELAAANAIHAMDSYSVGVLIPYFFHGSIPGLLQKAVQRMMTPSIKMRPRLQPLLKCPLFQNPYQQSQLQLEELAIQPIESKIVFWQNLHAQLQGRLVPDMVAYYKLLPLIQTNIHTIADSESLRAQDLYRRELLALLAPFFVIVERYTATNAAAASTANSSDYKSHLVLIERTIASLFRVNDRGIRGSLLQKMQYLSKTLDASALNNSVFEPLCSGFSDSSSALRELTLKSTLVLVPHLTQPNLEKLSRYLVRLQSDPEPSIRTNTIIFCSKLASHLTETTRQKMLLPALVRALKDNFTPCRLAALQSVLQTKEFFDPPSIATSVLPVVTPQLLDPVAEVRREAFLVVDDLLFLLRQESARMPSQVPTAEAGGVTAAQASQLPPHAPAPSSGPALSAATPIAPAPASGGYLSGLSSWVTSSAKPTTAAAPTPANLPPSLPPQAPIPAARVPSAPQPPIQGLSSMQLHTNAATTNDFDLDEDDNDGWGDDDDVEDDLGLGNSSRSGTSSRKSQQPLGSATGSGGLLAPAKEDDFFGAFDSKLVSRPIGGAAVKAQARKGKLTVPTASRSPAAAATKSAKPAVTKLDLDDDPVGDGWDDF